MFILSQIYTLVWFLKNHFIFRFKNCVESIQPVLKTCSSPNCCILFFISFGINCGEFWYILHFPKIRNITPYFIWNNFHQWPHKLSSAFSWETFFFFVQLFTNISFSDRHSHLNKNCLGIFLSWWFFFRFIFSLVNYTAMSDILQLFHIFTIIGCILFVVFFFIGIFIFKIVFFVY